MNTISHNLSSQALTYIFACFLFYLQYTYKNRLGICTQHRPLTGKDILLLRPTLDEGAPATSLWLDDAVIDYFLAEYDLRDKKLVAGNSKKTPRMPTKFFSCHFIDRIVSGDSNVKRWSKGQTLSNFDKLILPVNIGNYHWALLVVRMAPYALAL